MFDNAYIVAIFAPCNVLDCDCKMVSYSINTYILSNLVMRTQQKVNTVVSNDSRNTRNQ